MFTHHKKPLFPVKVGEVNPKFAQKLLEQFGGRDGEGEMGIGKGERGPWNEGGRWNFVAKPEETLKARVEGPKKS